MKYGYIRVSTREQNEERQIETMHAEGIDDRCLFIDKMTGASFDRPKYQELMTIVKPGDKIVVDSLDRLGRDYEGLISEWKRLTHEEGVNIQALDMPFMDSEYFEKLGDLGKLVEDLFLGILSWVAEHERLENHRRQKLGIERAKAQGKFKGKPKKQYDPELIARAETVLRNEGKAAAARVLGCHVNTVTNMIADGRLHVAA